MCVFSLSLDMALQQSLERGLLTSILGFLSLFSPPFLFLWQRSLQFLLCSA